jgi:hypothetical protein
MPTANIPIKRFSDSRMGEKDRHGNCFCDLVDCHRNFFQRFQQYLVTLPPATKIVGLEARCSKICRFIEEDPKLVTPGSVVRLVMYSTVEQKWKS